MHVGSECLDSGFWQKLGQFCVPTVLFERCSNISLILQKMRKNIDESIRLERKKKITEIQERKKNQQILFSLPFEKP